MDCMVLFGYYVNTRANRNLNGPLRFLMVLYNLSDPVCSLMVLLSTMKSCMILYGHLCSYRFLAATAAQEVYLSLRLWVGGSILYT